MAKRTLVALLFVSVSVGLHGQKTTSAKGSNQTIMPMMPLVAPLFIEDGEFTSALVIVNASVGKTYADVALRDTQGHTVVTQRVPLAANSQARVSLADMLHGANSNVTTGSVLVMPSEELMGMAVAAQLTMTYHKYAQLSYIDEEVAMPSMEGSQELHGVADTGEGAPLVGIANLSESTQHISITCLAEHGPSSTRTVEVGGSATALVRGCQKGGSGTSFDLDEDQAGRDHQGALGILLRTDGTPGSFAAFAINPHRDNEAVAFTSVPFSDPKMNQSPSTVFVGVPIGQVPLLAERGQFEPTLSLTNFGGTAVDVSVRMASTVEEGGVSAAPVIVKPIKIAALTSTSIKLSDLTAASGLRNSLIIESNGDPGQVGVKLLSYDETANLRIEQLDKDLKHMENAGLHPWSLEEGADSTLLLFNPYDLPNTFDVHISTGSSLWYKAYELRPFETMAIDLRQLQLEQTKDDRGITIPRFTEAGQVDWSNMSGPKGTGRMMISNHSRGMARSFSCASYFEVCGVSINPGGAQTIALNGSVSFSDSVTVCWAYNPGVCSGTGGGYTSLSHSWSASSPLTGAGACAGSSYCSISGPSSGTGYVAETVTDYWGCSITSGSTRVNVSDPTPKITSVSPPNWNAGSTTAIKIMGSGFGTSPTVSVTDPSAAVSVGTITYKSDTEIDLSVTVTASAPSENATVTVTSQGYNGYGFISNQGNSPSSPSTTIAVNPILAPPPRILFGGTDVTGTTQSVVVGQKIALGSSESIPAGLIKSGDNWTIPGTLVGGYSGGTVVVPTLGGSPVIYWVYAGQSLVVQYSYCMNNNQCSQQVSATFNVTGPSGGTMVSTPISSPQMHINTLSDAGTSAPYLVYGNLSGSLTAPTCNPCGISFLATGYTNDSGGSYLFGQIINTDNITGSYSCTTSSGLDDQFPYGNSSPKGTADSPPLRLDPTDTTLTRTFNATMYLFWQSSTTNSIPVPLGYQQWKFSGTATCSASCQSAANWAATTNSSGTGLVNAFVASTPAQPFSGYPTWSGSAACH